MHTDTQYPKIIRAPRRCLLCLCEYPFEGSPGRLYPEAFCSVECERLFAAHVLDFHRKDGPQMPQVEFGHTSAPSNGSAANGAKVNAAGTIRSEPAGAYAGKKERLLH
jgi:hypothetical protein